MFKRVNEMEKEITYRHNIMTVNSLDTFLSVKGGFNGGRRDVYFVRALGCGSGMEDQILAMDRRMGSEMQKKVFYTRMRLPSPLIPQEEMYFYSSQFAAWKAGRKLSVRNQAQDGRFCRVLGDACTETVEKYRLVKKNMTESIEKNFVIKLLYWTDRVLGCALADWNERKCFKILMEDVQKEQDYLFCYMLTLLGCDVLLLECRKDISAADALKALSAEFRLGEFKDTLRLPEYMPCEIPSELHTEHEDRNAKEPSGPVRVVIPEKPGRRNSCTQMPMQSTPQPRTTLQPQTSPQPRTTPQPQPSRQPRITPQPRTTPQPAVSGKAAGNSEKSFEELALLASSIVMIAVYDREGEPIATGSGIMIGRDGYILTNNHVTRGGCFFAVRIEDNDNIYKTNEIIKYNTVLDLAVIRIDRRLAPLPLYRGKKLVRGQKVVAIGSPLGMFNSVSDGIISGFRNIDSVDMIQFTAPISHGSSGGAVLNMYGEVIGISTAGFDNGQNINLAVGYEFISQFVRGFTG